MTNVQKVSLAAAAVVVLGAAGAFFLWPKVISPNGHETVLTPRVDRGIEPKDEQMLRDRIASKETAYREAAANGENGINLLLQIGNTYYTLGELDTAVSYYDRILADFPNDAPSLENKGQALLEMGDFAGAETVWRKAIVVNPIDVTYLRLADLIATRNPDRVPEVRLLLEQAISTIGQSEGLMIALGNWYKGQDMLEEAISHYEVALALNPKNATVKQEIAALRAELAKRQLRESGAK